MMGSEVEWSGGRYPSLPTTLASQLAKVSLSGGYLRPCLVTLDDGTTIDRVYLAEASQYIRQWGVWPENDRGKHSIPIDRIVSVKDSPSRLPPKFADELYAAGESGMGYTIFTVCFADGSDIKIGTGNAVDFIDYPAGQSPASVVKVLPHVGRNDPNLRNGPRYSWSLYENRQRSWWARFLSISPQP